MHPYALVMFLPYKQDDGGSSPSLPTMYLSPHHTNYFNRIHETPDKMGRVLFLVGGVPYAQWKPRVADGTFP